MKKLAAAATLAVVMMPTIAAACSMHSEHVTQISCADGQTFDEKTRSCVTQTS